MPLQRRILDLFCCSGGAGRGYQAAGFYVTGVDIDPQPNYAGDLFVQSDAIAYLSELIRTGEIARYAAIHASPPCQTHSALTKANRKRAGWSDGHVDLITPIRPLLELTGLPYVIENVAGAPIRKDIVLCGEMFGLDVIRHRYFEFGGGWKADQPTHPPHRGRVAGMRHGEWFTGPYFAVYGEGGGKGTVEQWQQAMGIDWTDVRREIAEAIPPAYTLHLGKRLLATVTGSYSTVDNTYA